jgi:hypothetical protein
MGKIFIIDATIVGGGLRGILVSMCLGLQRNNLNSSLPKALSVTLLL